MYKEFEPRLPQATLQLETGNILAFLVAIRELTDDQRREVLRTTYIKTRLRQALMGNHCEIFSFAAKANKNSEGENYSIGYSSRTFEEIKIWGDQQKTQAFIEILHAQLGGLLGSFAQCVGIIEKMKVKVKGKATLEHEQAMLQSLTDLVQFTRAVLHLEVSYNNSHLIERHNDISTAPSPFAGLLQTAFDGLKENLEMSRDYTRLPRLRRIEKRASTLETYYDIKSQEISEGEFIA